MVVQKKWIHAGLLSMAIVGNSAFAEGTAKAADKKSTETKITKGQKVDLSTDKAQLSYAIGSNVGEQLKRDFSEQEIDVDIMATALKDQLSGRESQLSTESMVKVFQDLQKSRRDKMEKEAIANKAKGAKYLEENLKKPGTKAQPSGLQYRVITAVKDGVSPKETDKVKVHYAGTLIDGSEFDSSYKRNQPATFVVNELIPGWQEALQMMKPGEKWEITVPSDLAYGEAPRPNIPSNSVLNFVLELQEIVKE
ncbi:MAG: FKBP-type peptidyl-prolyl cis-trans isomerase [Zetaproteobacteria bacterium]|nr:FKBP-type peptidyl-prolyl cis-trans isomerase [Zetaproteobacteria bacterium]